GAGQGHPNREGRHLEGEAANRGPSRCRRADTRASRARDGEHANGDDADCNGNPAAEMLLHVAHLSMRTGSDGEPGWSLRSSLRTMREVPASFRIVARVAPVVCSECYSRIVSDERRPSLATPSAKRAARVVSAGRTESDRSWPGSGYSSRRSRSAATSRRAMH